MSESGTGEPDIDYQTALAKFHADLNTLHVKSGIEPYRTLARKSEQAKRHKLSLSGIYGALNGTHLPTYELIIELVRLLDPDPEVGRQWGERHEELRELRDSARAATAHRKDATTQNAPTEADLRMERDNLKVEVNDLTAQRSALLLQIVELTSRAAAAEKLTEHLQRALYANWPPGGRKLGSADGAAASSVAFRPGGRRLAVGYGDGMLRSWDPDTAEYKWGHHANLHGGAVHCVAYCGSGDVLVAGSDDGLVELVDPETGNLLGVRLVRSGPPILAVAFSPRRKQPTKDWQYSLAVGDESGYVRVWHFSDQPGGDPDVVFPAGGPVRSLAFAPDHDALVVGTDHASVTVRGYAGSSVRGGPSMLEFTGQATVQSLCFGSGRGARLGSGSAVLAVADADGRVHLFVISTGEPFHGELREKHDAGFSIQSVAASPVSPLLAIGGKDGLILWEFHSRMPAPSMRGDVRSIAFRPDGKLMALGLADGSTQLHLVP